MAEIFLPEYEKRKNEVQYFLEILKKFDSYDKKASGKKLFNFQEFTYTDYFKMLRSSFILILYSYIENSISLFMQELYSHLESEDISYSMAIDNLKELYLKNLFVDTFKKDASYNTYERNALELIKQAIEDKKIKLTIAKLNISGNVSGEVIKKIWENHGIKFSSSSKSLYPTNQYTVDTIKNQRNALAHGRESFKESGGKYSVLDLERYYTEISKLLDDLKLSIKNFIEKKEYLL